MQINSDQLYDMFAQKDKSRDGLVFMGVRTTGIFCRPGCPARMPLKKNCTFHQSAQEALNAGYRACLRCHPMRLPSEASHIIKTLIGLVESDPERRWSETDIKSQGIDPTTARRHFKSRFGMTFSNYARRRRMAHASSVLKAGDKVIDAQLSAGYDSPSGFRAAFSKTFGEAPKTATQSPLLIEWIDTPLGPMIAVCDEDHLYLLEFTNRKNIDRQFQRLAKIHKRAMIPGRSDITDQIESEMGAYFSGALQDFKTPMIMSGTDFQKSVWHALIEIPYGQKISYSDLAQNIGNERAVRAVASSNANNGMAIIIPCHRVIAKGGGLGGYAGGLDKKSWLLTHELKHL